MSHSFHPRTSSLKAHLMMSRLLTLAPAVKSTCRILMLPSATARCIGLHSFQPGWSSDALLQADTRRKLCTTSDTVLMVKRLKETLNAHNSPLERDFIGKGISRGAEWHKFQLHSTFQ